MKDFQHYATQHMRVLNIPALNDYAIVWVTWEAACAMRNEKVINWASGGELKGCASRRIGVTRWSNILFGGKRGSLRWGQMKAVGLDFMIWPLTEALCFEKMKEAKYFYDVLSWERNAFWFYGKSFGFWMFFSVKWARLIDRMLCFALIILLGLLAVYVND